MSSVSRSKIALVALLCATLAGCAATRGGNIPYNVADFRPPDPVTAPALDADYRIAALDKLTIRVFRFDDLSGDYPVDLTGTISMPLIGSVRVLNMSTDELKAELTKRLGAKYIQNPDVSVGIKESAGSVVTVEGSVRQPGLYPVLGPMTLLQAVATARGYDENANPRRVAIFRTIDGKRMAAAFDLVAIRRGTMDDPRVYRGDIVVVDGSTTKSAFKNILQTLPIVALFGPI